MSIRELFPGGRDGEAAQDAASLLAGITLPPIEPFGSDNEALAGLPDRPTYLIHDDSADADTPGTGTAGAGFDAVPATRMSVARGVYDAGIQALSVMKCLQDAMEGCKARLVARVSDAAAVEAAALSLDRWQSGVAASSAATEIAMALGIPELTAAALEHHATELVREHPEVLAALEAGDVSWRHATIINDEISTLKETPGTTDGEAALLEARLLVLAQNTTAASFAGKARRAREKMHPETITTRTKEAFAKRKIGCDVGTDGMSWLSLHVPTVSASAIYTRCTRLARAVKLDAAMAQRAADLAGTGQDCIEHRTLAQLRADIATILLLGQDRPTTNDTTNFDGAGNDGGAAADAAASPADARNAASGTRNGNGSTSCGTGNESGAGGGASDKTAAGAGQDVPFGQASAFGVTVVQESRRYVPPWNMKNSPAAGSAASPAAGPAVGSAISKSTPDTQPETLSDTPLQAPPETVSDTPLHAPPDTSSGTALGAPPGSASGVCAPLLEGTGAPASEQIPAPPADPPSDPAAGAADDEAPQAWFAKDEASQPWFVSDETPEDDPGAGAAAAEVLVGELLGEGSGYVDGVVDGVPEDPEAEYRQQLQDLAGSKVMVDPPLPEALVIVTVPFLGLLGFTDEPAELAGPQGGPVPQELARKLLANSSSFLRVLTDPITGEVLPLEPQRYTLRAAEKAVLQALAGGCYFPNCPNPVMDTDLDHLRAFEFGGLSTLANLRPACRRHHVLKHFKDDKDRHGRRRSLDEPERYNIKLRGWTAKITQDGRIGWITPSGSYRPPLNTDPQRPRYPKWLKILITKAAQRNRS